MSADSRGLFEDERYLALAEAATDAVVIMDEDGFVRYANPAVTRVFGYSSSETVGARMTMLMPERYREAHERGLRRYLKTGERRLDWEMAGVPGLHASGREMPLEVSFTEFFKEKRRYFAGFIRDVSERVRTEAERDRFFTLSPDLLCVANRKGFLERVNPAFEETLGYSARELLERPFLDFVHPEDRGKTVEELEKLSGGEPTVHFENRYLAKDESVVWLSWKATPVVEEGLIYAAARDVTGRKLAESEIRRRSEQQAAVSEMGRLALTVPSLRSLMDEAVRIVAGILDLGYCAVMELLPGTQKLLVRSSFGWEGDVVSGRYTVDAGFGSHSGYTLASDEPVVMEDADAEERFSVPSRLREHGIKSGISSVIRGEERVFGVLVAHSERKRSFTTNDVDFVQSIANVIAAAVDHRRHEEEIKAQSERLKEQAEILDLAHVLIRDMDDRVIFWNSGTELLYGFSREEAVGRTTHELLKTEHPESYEQIRRKILSDGFWDGELVHTTRDGRRMVVASHCVLHRDSRGEPVAILEVNNDVTGLREAEEELSRTDRRFRSLVQNLADVISIIDTEGVFLYASPSVERVLGVEAEDLVGTSGFDLVHPEDHERAAGFLSEVVEGSARSSTVELRLRHADGFWRHIEANVGSMLDDPAVGGIVATFRDVTERKLADAAIRESEERLRLLTDNMKVGVLLVGADMSVIFTNPAASELLGFEGDPASGGAPLDAHWDALHEDGTPVAREDHPVRRAFSEGRFVKDEVMEVYRPAFGDRRWLLISANPQFGENGEVERVACTVGDLEERKRAERELRESHALLASIIEGTDDAIFMKDESGRYLMVNSRTAAILGRTPDEIVGKNDVDLLPPEAAIPLMEADRRVLSTGEPLTVEEMLPVEGTLKNFIVTKSAFRDHEGETVGVIGVATDVTGLKETEKALRETESLYRAVVEQATENIFLVDTETKRVIQANSAFYESLGYTAEEMEDLTLYDIVAHDRESVDRNVELLLESGRLYLGERVYLRKDGTFLEVEVGAAAISYGDLEAMCVVAHDITERKEAEEALSEVREAERRRIARDLHDLSLQHIASALQMMQAAQIEDDHGEDSDLARQISALREAVRGLRGAIYDLRLEGSQPFVRSVESLVELNRQLYPERETKLEVSGDFPRDLPETTKTQLTRVVQEALTNIRRHSEAKTVEITLSTEGDERIEVRVSDDGRGFDVSEVFTEGAADSAYGVGLSGMSERMRAIGGEISVESEPGIGTTVTFRVAL